MEVDTRELADKVSKLTPVYQQGEDGTIYCCVMFRTDVFPNISLSATSKVNSAFNNVKASNIKSKIVGTETMSDIVEFAVPGKTLMSLISKMTAMTIRFAHHSKKPGWILLITANSEYEIPTLPILNLPYQYKEITMSQRFMKMNKEEFLEATKYGSRFNSNDESRGALYGVSYIFSANSQDIECHTTDGAKLARCVTKSSLKITFDHQMVVSKTQCSIITEMLQSVDDDDFLFALSGKRLLFMCTGVSLLITPMEYQPTSTVKQVTAAPFNESFDVNRREILDCIARLEKVQDDEFMRLIFSIDSGNLKVRKVDVAKGKASETLPIKNDTVVPKTEFACVSRYIHMAINAFDKCEVVTISLFKQGSDVRAVMFKSSQKKQALCVVSPVSLEKTR